MYFVVVYTVDSFKYDTLIAAYIYTLSHTVWQNKNWKKKKKKKLEPKES